MTTSDTIFSERQHFRQVWLWLLLIAVNGLFIYGFVSQAVFGQTFGDKPMGNTGLLITTIVMLLFTIFFWLLRLDTEIKKDGIYYRFYPFQLSYKQISWDRISKSFVRQYSPLTEYGGWGFRIGIFGNGQAFNVSGDKGLQLVYDNNKKFLIGTQNADEIEKTLKQIGQLKT
jgi:hypothetical protein